MESTKKRLLFSLTRKDFQFQAYRASGPGGQHRNKVATAMRCLHPASGATGEASDSKSQHTNKRNAFLRCVESDTFRRWHRVETARRSGDLDRAVNEQMQPRHIRVEYFDPENEELNDANRRVSARGSAGI